MTPWFDITEKCSHRFSPTDPNLRDVKPQKYGVQGVDVIPLFLSWLFQQHYQFTQL